MNDPTSDIFELTPAEKELSYQICEKAFQMAEQTSCPERKLRLLLVAMTLCTERDQFLKSSETANLLGISRTERRAVKSQSIETTKTNRCQNV